MSNPDAKILNPGPSPRGWHRLQLAAECLQKYSWQFNSPVGERFDSTAPALAKGSLVHLALAQHYMRMRVAQQGALGQLASGETVDDWCEPEEAVELMSKLNGTNQYAAEVIDTFHAYCDYYDDDLHTMKILEVESLYDTTIGGKYLLTGRLDLVYEDLGGRVWGLDHKTTARILSRHKEFYTISGQLLGYSHMVREKYGDRYAGFKVNLIQHGGSKLNRITLPRSPNLEARFAQTVLDIEESIERMEATERDFDDWPKAMNELTCYHRYGACEYLDQCRWGAGAKKAGNWDWVG